MRRILLGSLLVGTLLVTGAWTYPQPPVVDRQRIDAEVNQALRDLAEVEQSLRFGDRGDTARELAEIRARLISIRALVGGAPVYSGPAVISPERLDRALRRLSMTRDAQAKLELVQRLAGGNAFTVAQVVQVTQFFYGQREKLQVIEILAAHVVDPQNHVQLQAVVFSPEARGRIARLFQYQARAGSIPNVPSVPSIIVPSEASAF